MSTSSFGLPESVSQYLRSVSVPEDPHFEAIREATTAGTPFNMQICPEQGQMMSVLLQMIGAKKALEVGTFTGFSALCIARALPADGQLITCDVRDDWPAIGQPHWRAAGVAERIDLRIGPAVETLEELMASGHAGSFDFAFIDADKQNYSRYYELCLELVRSGGAIGIDNTLWGGTVADPNDQEPDTLAIRALNQQVYEDDRVHACLIPIGDGFTLARKR